MSSAPHGWPEPAPVGRIAFVNGRYLPHARAAVHIEDRGLQFADAIYEVVGVVPDVKQHGPRDQMVLRFYLPHLQHREPELNSARFMLRTAANPAAVLSLVQQAIQSEDKRLPIVSVDTARGLEDRSLVQERMIPDPDAKQYNVQLASTPGFGSPIASDTTENSVWVPQIDSTQAAGKLYWRLAAIDEGGSVGAYDRGIFTPPHRRHCVKRRHKRCVRWG